MEFGTAVFAENKYDYIKWTDSNDADQLAGWAQFVTMDLYSGAIAPIKAIVEFGDSVELVMQYGANTYETVAFAWPGEYIVYTGALLFVVMDEREFMARSDSVSKIWGDK